MRIGFSIFLLAIGAILPFAVNYTIVGVDIHIVGWILMVAGIIGLILTMLVAVPRNKRTTVTSPDCATTQTETTAPAPRANIA